MSRSIESIESEPTMRTVTVGCNSCNWTTKVEVPDDINSLPDPAQQYYLRKIEAVFEDHNTFRHGGNAEKKVS